MGGGGIAVADVVYGRIGSPGWAAVALVLSAPVRHIVGQVIMQPARAILGAQPRPGAQGRRQCRDAAVQGVRLRVLGH